MLIKKFHDMQFNLLGGGLAVCVLSLALTGCSGGGGGGGNNNATATTGGGGTTGGGPTETISFTLTPQTLDFSKVVIGDTVAGSVVVSNTGTATFDPELGDLSEGFTLTNTCGTLDPDEECSLQIEFSPADQRMYESDTTVAADSEEVSLMLTGQGQGLNVEIASVEQNCPAGNFEASVLVSRINGTSVAGLRTDNATVYLNGTEVDLSSTVFESVSDRDPIAVGILMDLSGSLDGSETLLSDATSIFIDSLGHIEDGVIDRAALYKFGSEIDFGNSQAFIDVDAAGKDALDAALYGDFAESAANSKIWGATSRAAAFASEQTIPKQYLILLTDGRDNPYDPSTSPTVDELIEDVNNRGVSVFTIGFGDVDPGPLQRLADETGGFFFSDPSADALGQAFTQISSTFSDQYEIVISNPGSAEGFTLRIIDDAGREGEDSVTLPACP